MVYKFNIKPIKSGSENHIVTVKYSHGFLDIQCDCIGSSIYHQICSHQIAVVNCETARLDDAGEAVALSEVYCLIQKSDLGGQLRDKELIERKIASLKRELKNKTSIIRRMMSDGVIVENDADPGKNNPVKTKKIEIDRDALNKALGKIKGVARIEARPAD